MEEKNLDQTGSGSLEDKTQVISTQSSIIKSGSSVIQFSKGRIRRQKSSCPFLGLLPKMGDTSMLAGHEANLQHRLEELLENREGISGEETESRNSEISMLKQSLDWLGLKGV